MNSWQLLLLAVVAVLQPVSSFTETNVFDGRQCCDHQSFSRNPIDDQYRFAKGSEDRRLSQNEIREVKRLEVEIARKEVSRTPARQILDTRSQAQRRSERTDFNRERVDRYLFQRNSGTIRGVDLGNKRLSREPLTKDNVRQDDRNSLDTRNKFSQNEIRDKFDNKRARRVIETGDEIRQSESRRTLLSEEPRNQFRQNRNQIIRRDFTDRSILRFARNKMNTERRASLRDNTRDSQIMDRETSSDRRSRENVVERRRSAYNLRENRNIRNERNSEHDLRTRSSQRLVNLRDERRQENENRMVRNIAERSNPSNKITRRPFPDKFNRRTSENKDRSVDESNRDLYRMQRLNSRQGREVLRVESRRLERDLTVDAERDFSRERSSERMVRNKRSITTRSTLTTTETSRKYESARNTLERENIDLRFQNIRSDSRDHFIKREATSLNWQSILYALQGVYLCGLFIQMINEGFVTEKRKPRNLSCWTSNFVKAD